MAISLAVWSQAVLPGDGIELLPPADLRITNAALGEELADENSRSSLKLVYSGPDTNSDDDESDEDDDEGPKMAPVATVLCSLTPGKIEQAVLDIVLEGGQAIVFENTGKNVIYLNGNFIDQVPHDDPPSEDELGPSDDEEAFRLEDVSSDVEVELDELEEDDVEMDEIVRQEEEEEVRTSKKRPLELDNEDSELKTSSKAEKKKVKKLKGKEGEAVLIDGIPATKENGEATPTEKKEEEKKNKKKDKQKVQAAEKNGSDQGMREIKGGVKIRDQKPGNGREAQSGDKVRMRYTGKLDDGSVFDSNMKGKPFEFTLGEGDVIKGWDVGIAGMKEGGERVLVIPSSMGYGKRKQTGIPPGSTLNFEVKLLKIVA